MNDEYCDYHHHIKCINTWNLRVICYECEKKVNGIDVISCRNTFAGPRYIFIEHSRAICLIIIFVSGENSTAKT